MLGVNDNAKELVAALLVRHKFDNGPAKHTVQCRTLVSHSSAARLFFSIFKIPAQL
jgi:hypothetical protein